MDKQYSSFWGNLNYIGKTKGVGTVKVVVAGREIVVRESDLGLKVLRVTAGSKKSFIVFDEVMTGLHRVVAVYNHPKADVRLVQSLQPLLASNRLERSDLEDWDPDYLVAK